MFLNCAILPSSLNAKGNELVISRVVVGALTLSRAARCTAAATGKVYNVDKYLKDHPGGSDSITINAGTDTTEEFEAIHSKKAWKQLDPWYIGDLVVRADAAPSFHKGQGCACCFSDC